MSTTTTVTSSALMRYLKEKDLTYFQKIAELREVVADWLSYIPQTFPHYTRHTVKHSDEIVTQLSKMLFVDNDAASPVVKLSAAEVYILIAAAYLHDAGMVTSDEEKQKILLSGEWAEWTGLGGGGEKRTAQIEALREGVSPKDKVLRDFLADVQLRFLIAEFVRGKHHLRAGDVIKAHAKQLASFDFGDPQLQRTIADVCISHGLSRSSLEDPHRFPEERDIGPYRVNVRFIAILLRIGDLLDMSCDRACPLLLSAASPLPADSFAHWTQYSRIVHRLTSPKSIEISAFCDNQEEHRVLQDWCQWIVEEVENAAVVMSRAKRHGEWDAPRAKFGNTANDILIKPSPHAKYIFSQWRMELDQTEIFDRLIYDVYQDNEVSFVRELLQNALDATRCKLYEYLAAIGEPATGLITQVDSATRDKFPIAVKLVENAERNSLSGELETRTSIIIEDKGIGMSRQTIERYFLQIGKSYYRSPEFRRNYDFNPTSRFGVGFLSVFAVSERVTVDTFCDNHEAKSSPIRLILSGPRSYLLSESSTRTSTGTRIEVLLKNTPQPGEFLKFLKGACRKVEFPVHFEEGESRDVIRAEKPDSFICEIQDVLDGSSFFSIRVFPISTAEIEGEIYVFTYTSSGIESWCRSEWAFNDYLKASPMAKIPALPPSCLCLHGILLDRERTSGGAAYSTRIDYRGSDSEVNLARDGVRRSRIFHPNLERRLEEILRDHIDSTPLSKGLDGWKYKQALVDKFPVEKFWRKEAGALKLYSNNSVWVTSLESLADLEELVVAFFPSHNAIINTLSEEDQGKLAVAAKATSRTTKAMTQGDVEILSGEHREALFLKLAPHEVFLGADNIWFVVWRRNGETGSPPGDEIYRTKFRDSNVLAVPMHAIGKSKHPCVALNVDHEFVSWLNEVENACKNEEYGLDLDKYRRLMRAVDTPVRYEGFQFPVLKKYLDEWNKMPGIPDSLMAPDLEASDFSFRKQRNRSL